MASESNSDEAEILIYNKHGVDGLAYVSPGVTPEDILRHEIQMCPSMENEPPEGRLLFFADRKRRIDYVLAWRSKDSDPERRAEREKIRQVFERNLEEEGLELEHDIDETTGEDQREIQFTKIHAPWGVLSRYAEFMKIRMPIKELPDEIKKESFWEMMSGVMSKLTSPFDVDPTLIPPMSKKFTHVWERNKEYLFDVPENKDTFFSHATRSSIVDFILRRKKYTDDLDDTFSFGIKRLIATDVYESAYPLHEGSWKPWTKPSMRRLLFEHWSHWTNFYKMQPLDYVRVYFGEKVGLYFAWLGYYTYMLIPASVVGLIVFIYGMSTLNSNVVSQESCDFNSSFIMCPMCYKRCDYWNYASVCQDVRAAQTFDNGATVFFAVFMALWGTFFLEFWKREEAGIQFKWNLKNFEEEEEPPRPEYLMQIATSSFKKKHKVTGMEEPYLPFWRRRMPVYVTSFVIMLFMVLIAVAIVVGIIVYRMAVLGALYMQDQELLYKNASMVTSATAAIINLVFIFILNFVYGKIAIVLTDWECLRTQSEYDNSLTLKLYVLQFVNYYSSIFYVAFFKGRLVGRPGDYNTLFGARQEECQGGGCFMEVCLQLSVIMIGKQLCVQVLEMLVPRIKQCLCACFCKGDEDEEKKRLSPWEKDQQLEEQPPRGLYNEYLEMLIQFGFVTLFVAAFPLAPLFALLNNVIELRADADKLVCSYRRPRAARAATIGIWFDLLDAVSRIAILTNGFIIAITSSFIDRLVYRLEFSPDNSLHGYVNNSMSYFNTSDFGPDQAPVGNSSTSVDVCRYQDYREPYWVANRYEFTTQYWHVIAAKFAFVIVFENVIILLTTLLSYLIPDMPRKLGEQLRRETYLTNEIIMRTELERAKGGDGELSISEMSGLRHLVADGAHEGLRNRRPGIEIDTVV